MSMDIEEVRQSKTKDYAILITPRMKPSRTGMANLLAGGARRNAHHGTPGCDDRSPLDAGRQATPSKK
jgi:hypothetical protein